MPHVGTVVIEDDVEIGANSCVAAKDQPSAAVSRAGVTSVVARSATISSPQTVAGRLPRRGDSAAPTPLERSSTARTSASVWDGCPRKRVSRLMVAISTVMKPSPIAAK